MELNVSLATLGTSHTKLVVSEWYARVLLGVEFFIPAAMHSAYVISEVTAKRSARVANPVRWRRYL